jgi:hypothetical protein
MKRAMAEWMVIVGHASKDPVSGRTAESAIIRDGDMLWRFRTDTHARVAGGRLVDRAAQDLHA